MPRTDREVARTSPRGLFGRRWSVVGVLLTCLPGGFLAAVVLADYLTPDTYYRFVAPLIVAVPALAAATSGAWGAIAFTGLSVGTSFLVADIDNRLYTPSFYGVLVGLAVIFAVSLLPGHHHARRRHKLAQARSVAEMVQRALMPPVPAQINDLRTSAAYVPAEEEARIGGDLYEALETPHGVRMIVGDVQGKGLASVGATANLLGAFREIAPHAADLPALAERLEQSVQRYNSRAGLETNKFITATLLCIPSEPVAHVLCCGHPSPLLLHAGTVTDVQLSRPSLPLGLGKLSAGGHHVSTLAFAAGDCLLAYTDGVTDARDSGGVFYPLAERVTKWADAEQPEQLVKQLVQDLDRHTGGRLNDDAAVLASQREPPPRR